MDRGDLTDGSEVPAAEDAVACGPLWLSPRERCEARVDGRRAAISPQEVIMLGCLVEADGRILSRQDLYRAAMGHALPARSRAVDVHIHRIRKALGPVGRFIIGVPTRGYRLETFELGRLGGASGRD